MKPPLEIRDMRAAAAHATSCVEIIRQWLPVDGVETKSTVMTMDRWHSAAWELWRQFRTFHNTPGSYYTAGPKLAAEYWRELADGMDSVCDHYGWREVDGVNRLPHIDVRGGEILSPISETTLARIEQAAAFFTAIPDSEDENSLLREACRRCNAGIDTWREIALFVDGEILDDAQVGAVTQRVKRFAKANGIRLTPRAGGRKPRKTQ